MAAKRKGKRKNRNQEIKWKRLNNQQLYDSTIKFVFDDTIEEEGKEDKKEVKI